MTKTITNIIALNLEGSLHALPLLGFNWDYALLEPLPLALHNMILNLSSHELFDFEATFSWREVS
jgi:hypothetical protein